MSSSFKRVAIVTLQAGKDISETLSSLIAILKNADCEAYLERETAKLFPKVKLPTLGKDHLAQKVDLVLVIGGDGAMLHASSIAFDNNLPILGINRGSLGFLTDILPEKVSGVFEILHGNFLIEERFLLEVKSKSSKTTKNARALNEVALFSGTRGKIAKFDVLINQHFVSSYQADGLILSTPTGSTAHALSGGGPILEPSLESVVLVPILSHNLSSRAIVIQNDAKITLKISPKNLEPLVLSCDGKIVDHPPANTSIQIKKAKAKLKLLHPKNYDYFQTLRAKLHWERC
jgi:NAD+ kinase